MKKQLGKPWLAMPCKVLHAAGPIVAERLTAAAVDFKAGAAGVACADLEAGGEDDAVDQILDAFEHQPGLGDALDAAAERIDQGDVRAVEGRQIVVVEGRTLAELPVPRLERLGRLGVVDRLIDPGADLVHLAEVRQLHLGGHGLRCHVTAA